MYATSYKLNNSYTTYVIHDDSEDNRKPNIYQKPSKPLEWKCGAKVSHPVHGKGVICSMPDHRIFVQFNASKAVGRRRARVVVEFSYAKKPTEIMGLRLCAN